MSLKEPARVVWQAGDCQHHGYQAEGVLVFDGELYVLVALGNGATEPHHRLGLGHGALSAPSDTACPAYTEHADCPSLPIV